MWQSPTFALIALLAASAISCPASAITDDERLDEEEIAAEQFINAFNIELNAHINKERIASWAYASNITDHNLGVMNDASANEAKFTKDKVIELNRFHYSRFKNADLRRKFDKMASLGTAALPDDKYRQFLDAVSAMESNYAKVRVCAFNDRSKCDLQLEPELSEIFEKSRDPEELKYYWQQWYGKAGAPTRQHFDTYVALMNEAAALNNFSSGAEAWLHEYEDPNFEQSLDGILNQIRPLYEQLHGYVRHKLRAVYGENVVKEDEPIPMHLLGNMWAQSWDNIASLTTPFPNQPLLDVTDEMLKQNYTALQMFEMGDEFFQSLNMTKLPNEFWERSILEKPTDGRDLVCHASAWDFFQTNDVRIKQCTRINMGQLFVVHHELGHIQYYLQYQHQPSVYRRGANPGFHEAVGDVLALSVATPKHLQKIGLLKDYVFDEAAQINQLYRNALSKIIVPSFAYTIDKYRWAIFRQQIPPNEYNCRFWQLREEYSGIVPPVARSEADFDPAAKYHISANVEYLRYFVSYIVQFQFHKAACEKAGEYEFGNAEKTLSNCDIYQSANAGNALRDMLSLGSSRPWPEAMEVLTGTQQMDASAILEYFRPLHEWLVKANKESGAHIGWKKSYQCA